MSIKSVTFSSKNKSKYLNIREILHSFIQKNFSNNEGRYIKFKNIKIKLNDKDKNNAHLIFQNNIIVL